MWNFLIDEQEKKSIFGVLLLWFYFTNVCDPL
jgi:hypothetical protein